MSIATLTSKGQLTLPKEVRDYFHLEPGDKIEFQLAEGAAAMRPLKRSVAEVFGCLSGYVLQPLTLDEMNQSVRQMHQEQGK